MAVSGNRVTRMANQVVIVQFFGFDEKFWTEEERSLDPLFALEDELIAALNGKNVGELDGHEIAVDGSDGCLFFYGPDANALFAAIEHVLRASPVTQGGNATLRYGGHDEPNVLEKYVSITPQLH
jgi:hypothetical protein